MELAPFTQCEGEDHLDKVFEEIVEGGGEGVILRDPRCLYQPGRSGGYLKHKVRLHPFLREDILVSESK